MTSNSIGRVIEVHGFHVKVELDGGCKSPVRASLEGAETQIKINACVTFEIGAGDAVLGMITDLYSREVYEQEDERLSLELVRPRRVATAQLLGTIRRRSAGVEFDPGVNVLPTLDTLALPATTDILKRVLEEAPLRNRPRNHSGEDDYDARLLLGQATAAQERGVNASYNDCFSRPLAVVGNTGSGKSCTIAHLIQTATSALSRPAQPRPRPKFFVIDINGEYSRAFLKDVEYQRRPDRIYVNGSEFSVPLWLMNASEVCIWLNAAEQTQQPALTNLWALAKGSSGGPDNVVGPQVALQRITGIASLITKQGGFKKGPTAKENWAAAKSHYPEVLRYTEGQTIERILDPINPDARNCLYNESFGEVERDLLKAVDELTTVLARITKASGPAIEQTADKPLPLELAKLDNTQNLETAAELAPGDGSLQQFLTGLQLRIQNRRKDIRWQAFYNFDELGIKSASDWYARLGIRDGSGADDLPDIVVIDCSMLSYEVLPYACGIVGRMLLELREHVEATKRFEDPWVIVLEEAHNYISPRRQNESRSVMVSREAFERIAKEGRKFGLSLIVANQRPSDISQTVLSECSNFIIHRLQNPEDIEHFRNIVPSQSRRLLDQITILRAGEAIVVGSAFNVPLRVQIRKPSPEPSSESSSPWIGWRSGGAFPVSGALDVWIGQSQGSAPFGSSCPNSQPADTPANPPPFPIDDDDIRFYVLPPNPAARSIIRSAGCNRTLLAKSPNCTMKSESNLLYDR